jgi:hypothetical protein
MMTDEVKRLKALEFENPRLKKMVAESELAIEVMKEIAAKNGEQYLQSEETKIPSEYRATRSDNKAA